MSPWLIGEITQYKEEVGHSKDKTRPPDAKPFSSETKDPRAVVVLTSSCSPEALGSATYHWSLRNSALGGFYELRQKN